MATIVFIKVYILRFVSTMFIVLNLQLKLLNLHTFHGTKSDLEMFKWTVFWNWLVSWLHDT